MITYDLSTGKSHEILKVVHVAKWRPPPPGWVKLNVDGSWKEDGRAGAGMVLRDNLGNILYSSCRVLFCCRDALKAEIGACMEDLSLAIQRTDLPIQIELDSLSAVNIFE